MNRSVNYNQESNVAWNDQSYRLLVNRRKTDHKRKYTSTGQCFQSDQVIHMDLPKTENILIEDVILYHELGHLITPGKCPPKFKSRDFEIFCKLKYERKAWKWAVKELSKKYKKKDFGLIVGAYWITYLIWADKIKNPKRTIKLLDKYQAITGNKLTDQRRYLRNSIIKVSPSYYR